MRAHTLILTLGTSLLFACGDKSEDTGEDEKSGPVDNDGDGYNSKEDCDDDNVRAFPGNPEVCDGLDNDCDGTVDNDASDADEYFTDSDGDGYGDPANPVWACDLPSGAVDDARDCDDSDSGISPDASEICDSGIDNDCDGVADDDDPSTDESGMSTYYLDVDGDGFGNDDYADLFCEQPDRYVTEGGDCDDIDPLVLPGTTWYPDLDEDGYGDESSGEVKCNQPPGTTNLGGDCDDENDEIHPRASEVCDGIDNDCDALTDHDDDTLDASTITTWYEDGDSDGYGLSGTGIDQCLAPSGYADMDGDCDDTTDTKSPGLAEVCGDDIDNDCSGDAPECELSGVYTDADALLTISGSSNGNMGYDFAIGDVNGDGIDDMISPEYGGFSYAGQTFVNYGPITGDVDTSLTYDVSVLGALPSDYSGRSVDAGDFDGDGKDDILLMAYLNDEEASSAGAAYLIMGSSSLASDMTLGTDEDIAIYGEDSSDYFGYSGKFMGDANGDGMDEILVGAYYDDNTYTSSGAVYVFYGSSSMSGDYTSESDADYIFWGEATYDYLGDFQTISDAIDFDGDGLHDYVFSSEDNDDGGSGAGKTYVFYSDGAKKTGSADADDADFMFYGANTSDYLGAATRSAGDVNNDGVDDLIVGADGHDTPSSSAGAAYLISGSTTQMSGTSSVTSVQTAKITGTTSYDYLGQAAGAAGDTDGDGVGDFWVGAYGYDYGGSSTTGAAFLFLGPASGTINAGTGADATIAGSTSSAYIGAYHMETGDLDGDGAPEQYIGGYNSDAIFGFLSGGE